MQHSPCQPSTTLNNWVSILCYFRSLTKMMTAVIPYWLVKKEIQVVMDKIGNPGQKVSIFCPWCVYKNNIDYLDFPPNFSHAQCRALKSQTSIEGKKSYPLVHIWISEPWRAIQSLLCSTLLQLNLLFSSPFFLSDSIFSLTSFLSESSSSYSDLFSSVHVCMLSHFSCVWLLATLWTVAHHVYPMDSPGKNTGVSKPRPPPGESSQPRNWSHFSYVSCLGKQVLYL